MENSERASGRRAPLSRGVRNELIVVLIAAAIYLPGCFSPPSLMDDVDAVQAGIARNMLDSGDWVTARLDGVKYLEKSPLIYWTIAASWTAFGVADWDARLPIVLSLIALCWLTARIGRWAFSPDAGLWAGLSLGTCIGLFLFTRILIPDVTLTLFITLAMWAMLRALDEDERRPRTWAAVMAAAIGVGVLLKGVIAIVIPVGAGLLFLLVSRQLFATRTWLRLRPLSGTVITLLIAAPWHVLATLRNPPYFDFTMSSGPGHYRGFFWFYFINEHVLRFLNRRFPRDYNTVPRLWFWLLHLLWLFPWSVFLPAVLKLEYRPADRAGRTRLLAVCWIGFVLVFFTFSSTQEYYSMPCYPALALLLGAAIALGGAWVRRGLLAIGVIAALAAAGIVLILAQVWSLPAPGDISAALAQHPEAYTLSLGHMGDLTLGSFAYLRTPLVVAGLAFVLGSCGALFGRRRYGLWAVAIMMVLFLHAARLAMIVFDPYLSSRTLADALTHSPRGALIADDQYYAFSSVFFYANREALLLNGRVNNLEYGSNAPDAPRGVFIDDREFVTRWSAPGRCYLLADKKALPRFEKLVGRNALIIVRESGGKLLLANTVAAPIAGIIGEGSFGRWLRQPR